MKMTVTATPSENLPHGWWWRDGQAERIPYGEAGHDPSTDPAVYPHAITPERFWLSLAWDAEFESRWSQLSTQQQQDEEFIQGFMKDLAAEKDQAMLVWDKANGRVTD
jgi:hypothetical protein